MQKSHQSSEFASGLGLFSYGHWEDGNRLLLSVNDNNSNFLRRRGAADAAECLCVASFEQFRRDFIHSDDRTIGLAFRGQPGVWPLNSKLQRLWDRMDQVYRHWNPPWPTRSEADFAWLARTIIWDRLNEKGESSMPHVDLGPALLQHYGCPTMLLDWTMRIDIALYFAFADAPAEQQECVSVFVADVGKTHAMALRAMQRIGPTECPSVEIAQSVDSAEIQMPYSRGKLWAFLGQKSYVDIRFMAQCGLFARQPDDIARDHRDLGCFLAQPLVDDNGQPLYVPLPGTLLELRLPVAERPKVMRFLGERGITRERLFPSWGDIAVAVEQEYRDRLLHRDW